MPPHQLLLLAAALATLTAASPPVGDEVTTYEVDPGTGARCLDGSTPRYWWRGGDPRKVSIHLMGGAWCESLASCADRGYGHACYRGSSQPACLAAEYPGNALPNTTFAPVMPMSTIPSLLGARWGGGPLYNASGTNPLTSGWSKLWVHYCDGGSFIGDNATATAVPYGNGTVQLYFRGLVNLRATIADAIARFGIDAATDVLLGGDSAGGLAAYYHVDALAALLPRSRVSAAPDSGFFFVDASWPSWGGALQWLVAAMNGTGGLNAACVADAMRRGGDPALCAYPQVMAPYIAAPLFVMNGLYDPALDDISGGESGANATNVQRLGDELLALVNATVLSRDNNAAFLTGCRQHCGQWGQNQTLGPSGQFDDFNVTIDGVTGAMALAQWYTALVAAHESGVAIRGWPPLEVVRQRGGGAATARQEMGTAVQQQQAGAGAGVPSRLWLQAVAYPCSDCCDGGSGGSDEATTASSRPRVGAT